MATTRLISIHKNKGKSIAKLVYITSSFLLQKLKGGTRLNAKIIAIVNQKGGVGKTTTCANLGIGLAMENKKVLLVDVNERSLSFCNKISFISSVCNHIFVDKVKHNGSHCYEDKYRFVYRDAPFLL